VIRILFQIVFDFTGVWIQMFILTIIFIIVMFIFLLINVWYSLKSVREYKEFVTELLKKREKKNE